MKKTPFSAKISEKQVQKDIFQYLSYRPGKFWRQNTGAAVYLDAKGGKRFVRYGKKGASDITGLIPPYGKRVEIEVKKQGGVQSPDQKDHQAMIESEGGMYLLVDCLDDVIRAGL